MKKEQSGREINADTLMKFLNEFDAYTYKYFGQNRVNSNAEKMDAEEMRRKQMRMQPSCKLSARQSYETYEIAELVYCDEEKARDYSRIYDLMTEKFLGEFVGIEPVLDLYKPSYFVFEWMMHLEYNPQKKNYSYYRDHYIHQVRNLFEMFCFLDEFGYMDKCIDIYKHSNTLLAKSIRRAVAMECDGKDEQAELRTYRYIIFSSAIVTSAVHDIGYPIDYINRNLEWTEHFLPISNYFFEKKDEWQKIDSLLENSLLYKLAPQSEIHQRLKEGDHGAISACILLLKFYRDGIIYSLKSAQKMVIDNSAIAVYDHTLRYKNLGAKKAILQQNVFEENPFSFLFRMCDDLEEWDRVYFDITKQSNFLVCRKCGTIITRTVNKGARRKEKGIWYTCCCGKQIGENCNLFKYRRLAHIEACKNISIKRLSDGEGLIIDLQYDLLRLLQAAAYDSNFARKRADGLTELKKMLYGQKGMEKIYIQSFITNNPVAIKTEIMRRYLQSIRSLVGKNKNTIVKAVLKEIIEKIPGRLQRQNSKKVLEQHALFYLYMARQLEEIYGNLELRCDGKCKDKAEQMARDICREMRVTDDTLETLIYDCIYQAFLYVDQEEYFKDCEAARKKYFKMFYRSEYLVGVVDSYIQSSMYDDIRKVCGGKSFAIHDLEGKFDFYSDYYMFECLWEKAKMHL